MRSSTGAKRGIHLVGSVGLSDASTVFETVAKILGGNCLRIPDGETGDRGYWIRWQLHSFQNNPLLELQNVTRALPGFEDSLERKFFRIKDGANPKDITFGDLGYAKSAKESFRTFSKLKRQGTIAKEVKFLVALPTPVALLCGFIVFEDREHVEESLTAAVLQELRKIQNAIPHDQLSIQWDVCYEIVGIDGGPPLHFIDPIDGSAERIAALCAAVDAEVDVGLHICYGDPGHRHIVEPNSLESAVALINRVFSRVCRQIDFVHVPVPRSRDDDEYFCPLKALHMGEYTRLILGIVHSTDGIEGGMRRIRTASRFWSDFDIATECGFGRRDAQTIPDLLRLHKELCSI